VATKHSKRSGTKATAKRSSKTARPAARPTPAKAAVKPAAKPPAKPAARRAAPVSAAPRREAASAPSLTERTLALRDTIQHSKLTAADPWGYTPKARAWQARAEQLLDRLVAGAETAETRKAVEALAAEVDGDRDFREARRLF